MAWIESHQDLRTNPKAKRLARMLDVPLAQAIGHLHMLWWWALDHAFDGDLHRFDAYDVADAAGWDGDADRFVRALIACGPRGASGFLDGEPGDNSTWQLHDWHEFTDAMRSKREASEKAHHARWHKNRNEQVPGCRFCDAVAMPPQSDRNADADENAMRSQCADPQSADAPTRARTDAPEPEPEPGPTGTDRTDPTPPRAPDDFPPPPTTPPHDDGGGSTATPQDQTRDLAGRVGLTRLPKRLPTDLTDTLGRCLAADWTIDDLAKAIADEGTAGVTAHAPWLTARLAKLAGQPSPAAARRRQQAIVDRQRAEWAAGDAALTESDDRMADARTLVDSLDPDVRADYEAKVLAGAKAPHLMPKLTLMLEVAELARQDGR